VWSISMIVLIRSHVPYLCMGMEYQRTANLNLAVQFFEQVCFVVCSWPIRFPQQLFQGALACPTDPLVHHEHGVVAYNQRKWPFFILNPAINLCGTCQTSTKFTGVFFRYKEAIDHYRKALDLASKEALESWVSSKFNFVSWPRFS